MKCKDNKNVETICPVRYSQCFRDADFFDNSNRVFDKPLFYLSTDSIQIDSYMEITSAVCTSPVINWRITYVDETQELFVPFVNFTQPDTSVLKLARGTLENGLYIVALEVKFPSVSSHEWTEDLFVMKVVDPELVAYISGGEYLEIPFGNELNIKGNKSYDPSNESKALEPLQAAWSFVVFSSLPPGSLNTILTSFPMITLPSQTVAPHKIYEIQNGTEYVLKVETSLFPSFSYCMAVFSLSRGGRMASAMQIVKLMSNILPVSINCVYNCHVGRDRLFYYDRLELDLSIPAGTDTTNFTYSWSVLVWNTKWATFSTPLLPILTDTGISFL
ncbi:uncharacterized protein LOC132758225 [Ruditapes philippinarum]|uniref:uncharacterized protein LOC132758225 n=1 Tax=Ruditapes philippinarum TaxID=129788 RepID=UPI00295B44B9|nr:uncharacterized protein LOC132758225 [Ruditapes philippinarum]